MAPQRVELGGELRRVAPLFQALSKGGLVLSALRCVSAAPAEVAGHPRLQQSPRDRCSSLQKLRFKRELPFSFLAVFTSIVRVSTVPFKEIA
jgi:hypothetical protein